MIQSIGVDIVDIPRFEKIIDKWGDRFINRILTVKEISYCRTKANHTHSMAVRFAAKEAMIKCLSDDEQKGFRWHEMQVLNAENGRPGVILNGRLLRQLDNVNIFLSLSHSPGSAIATVVLEKK